MTETYWQVRPSEEVMRKIACMLLVIPVLTLVGCDRDTDRTRNASPTVSPDATPSTPSSTSPKSGPGSSITTTGGVRLVIRPASGPPGTVPKATVHSIGAHGFGWGNPYVLEVKRSAGWDEVDVMGSRCAWTLELRLVPAGGSSPSQSVQRCRNDGSTEPLGPGLYRYTKTIEIDGSRVDLKATFEIQS